MTDLLQILSNLLLIKTDLFFQNIVKIAAVAILHHEIYMIGVIKTRIKADDVGMFQKALNFYLAN
jgi:hypothetical protein